MSFMKLFTSHGRWYVVDTSHGTEVIPADIVPAASPADDETFRQVLSQYCEGYVNSWEVKEGWCARYSAPGYMDCTSWCGPYTLEKDAAKECLDVYGDDDVGEEIQD